jgi:dTDP-4-amino-4,6-dideoxygalactose transaminase
LKKLALYGGKKIRDKPFPNHPIITDEEKKAVDEVLDSGKLSTFIASTGQNFLGGEKIREFENNFAEYQGMQYAVAFNSATSALHAAIVAVGIKPGEEVIVSPYTFTSSATCALMHNAIPVFSDVKRDIYCLDPEKIDNVLSPLTRAIIPVHLFGHPCDMDEILDLATKKNLRIIEDCAQASGAKYKGKKVGTMGDCGIFSFQETKNMTTGEGGMLVTNNEEIAKAAQMVRNHGEVISQKERRTYRSEILGWGYRMTELEAAIGIVQLSKLDRMNNERIRLANHLSKKIQQINGLKHIKYKFVEHVYYVYAFSYDEKIIDIPRAKFCEAVRAEGIPLYEGYVQPLYLNPLYSERRAFAFKHYTGKVNYEKGICPIAETLYEKEVVLTPICRPPANLEDIDDIINAITKIIDNKNELIT